MCWDICQELTGHVIYRSGVTNKLRPVTLVGFERVQFDAEQLRFEGIVRRHLEIMTGAGILAGVIYWMIAGRNAGAWRAPPLPPRRPPPMPSQSSSP